MFISARSKLPQYGVKRANKNISKLCRADDGAKPDLLSLTTYSSTMQIISTEFYHQWAQEKNTVSWMVMTKHKSIPHHMELEEFTMAVLIAPTNMYRFMNVGSFFHLLMSSAPISCNAHKGHCCLEQCAKALSVHLPDSRRSTEPFRVPSCKELARPTISKTSCLRFETWISAYML